MYDAFISYSQRNETGLADALQRGLQKFAKPWYRIRAVNVFRDQTSLSAAPKLWEAIKARLDSCTHFVLLASEQSAGSEWVGKEVCFWLTKGVTEDPADLMPDQVCADRASRLLIVLASGSIVWDGEINDFDWDATSALPTFLKGVIDDEPLWIDLKGCRGKLANEIASDEIFRHALARLSAPLQNKDIESLIRHDYIEHRRTIRTAIAAVVSLSALLIVAIVAGIAAYQQFRTADANRIEAEKRASIARSQRLALQAQGVFEEDATLGILLASEAVQNSTDAGEYVAQSFHILHESFVNAQVPARRDLLGTVTDIDFGVDSGLLVASSGDWLFDRHDQRVLLWDSGQVSRGPHTALATNSEGVSQIELSSDERWLYLGTTDGRVLQWDLTNKNAGPVVLSTRQRTVDILATDNNTRWLLAVERNSEPILLNLELPSSPVGPFSLEHGQSVMAGTVDPQGRWAATSDYLRGDFEDEVLKIWNLAAADPAIESTSLRFRGPSTALITGSYGRLLVSTGGEQLPVWNVSAEDGVLSVTERQKLNGHRQSANAAAVHPTRPIIASGDWEGVIYVWIEDENRVFRRTVVAELNAPVSSLDFVPNSNYLAVLADGEAQLIDLAKPGLEIPGFLGYPVVPFLLDPADIPLAVSGNRITSVKSSDDGRHIAAGTVDGTVRVYDRHRVGFGDPRIWLSTKVLDWNDGWNRSQFVFDPSRRWIAITRNNTHELVILDSDVETADDFTYARSEDPRSGAAPRIEFAPNGRWMLLNAPSGGFGLSEELSIVDLETVGGDVDVLRLSIGKRIFAHSISADGSYLAIGDEGGRIGIWDLSGSIPASLAAFDSGLEDSVKELFIAPGGEYLFARNEVGDATVFFRREGGWITAPDPEFIEPVFPMRSVGSGRYLATNDAGELLCWTLDQATMVTELTSLAATGSEFPEYSDIALSSSNRWMVTFRKDSETEEKIADLWLQGHDGCSYNWTAQIEVKGRYQYAHGAEFSGDETWLSTSSYLWDLRDPESLQPLPISSRRSRAFSHDSKWFVTSNEQGIVLFDLSAENVTQTATVIDPDQRAFDEDLGLAISRSGYVHWTDWTTAYRVPISWPILREHAQRLAGRNLTDDEWDAYLPHLERRNVFELSDPNTSEYTEQDGSQAAVESE